jgi:hypothetical protein
MHSMPEPVPSAEVQRALHEFKQAPTNEQIEAKAWQLQRLYGADVAEEFEKTAKKLSPAAVSVEMGAAEEIYPTPAPKPEQKPPEPGSMVSYRDGRGAEKHYRRGGGPAQPESDAQTEQFRSFRSGDGSVKRYRRGGGPAQPESDTVPEASLLEKAKTILTGAPRQGRTEASNPESVTSRAPIYPYDGPAPDANPDQFYLTGTPARVIDPLPEGGMEGDAEDEFKRDEFRRGRRPLTRL